MQPSRGGGRQVSDYEINGAVRRELVARNVDLRDVRYRCSNGSVEVSGTLKFTETKSISEVAKELFILEQALSGIRGVRRVKLDFSDWERSASGKFARTVADGEEKGES